MVTNKIKELQALQARAVTLQAAIDAERNQELASLPGKYGFDNVAAFIQALRNAGRGKGAAASSKSKKKVTATAAAKATGTTGKRGRAKITPAIKAKVKAAVKAGTSGADIAKLVGISLPSVHNIKKELGLVKARKSKAV
jgi:hypothetical protein